MCRSREIVFYDVSVTSTMCKEAVVVVLSTVDYVDMCVETLKEHILVVTCRFIQITEASY